MYVSLLWIIHTPLVMFLFCLLGYMICISMYATHVSYVLYMNYYREKNSAWNCIGWNGVGTCLSLACVQHSEVTIHDFFSWTWGLLLVACRWCRRVKLGACMKGKHSALVQPEEVGPAYEQALNSVSHMGSNIAHQRGNGSQSGFLYLQLPT